MRHAVRICLLLLGALVAVPAWAEEQDSALLEGAPVTPTGEIDAALLAPRAE